MEAERPKEDVSRGHQGKLDQPERRSVRSFCAAGIDDFEGRITLLCELRERS
jgi:hypothetical protein